MDNRVEKLLSQMTRAEKIACTAFLGDTYGHIPRLEIPGYYVCDGTNIAAGGAADCVKVTQQEREQYGGFYGTCFPQMAVLSNSWSTELAHAVGRMVGEEAKAGGVGVLMRPGVNIKRSPLCGRNFEYFSEDPVLAGELGGAYISGVQENGVAACLKHYAVNSQEFERMTTNAVVSERALRELYLRVFQIAIKKGDPWTVMTSYNRVNGSYVHSSPMLMTALREEFGFTGAVMSDCFAVHYDKVKGHNTGLDLEMDDGSVHGYQLADALASGEMSEQTLDEIVRRVLTVYYRILDGSREKAEPDMKAHHEAAVTAAEEGCVLLKNDGLLPLQKTAQGMAVIGRRAKDPAYIGGGSGHQNGNHVENAYDCLCGLFGRSLPYADGYPTAEGYPPAAQAPQEELLTQAERLAEEAETVLLFVGYDFGTESEGYDRPCMELPECQRQTIERVLAKNNRVVLIVNTGSAVTLAPYRDRVGAILFAGLNGEGGGKATARILCGLAEPGGRLSETFPVRYEDTPAFLSFPRYPNPMHDVVYSEDIYVGYRWYDTRKISPLYPFGHGLSYTEFAYDGLCLSQKTMEPSETLTVSLTVQNVGRRRGSDVVQLYVRPLDNTIDRPEKELKAFAKVHLEPGEKTTVRFSLSREAFECYAPAVKKWVAEPGRYEICVGRSCQNILCRSTVKLHSKERAYDLNGRDALAWVVSSPCFREAVAAILPETQGDFFGSGWSAAMAGALPWNRLSEVDLGQGLQSLPTLGAILSKVKELEETQQEVSK